MKFKVNSSDLLNQLNAVYRVINAKNALQILDNFLIKIEGDKMYVTGSDQENTMTGVVEISESECDGAIAIPAKQLIDKLKLTPNQGLTFAIDENKKEVLMTYLNGHYDFMGVDAADYPSRKDDGTEKKSFEVPANVILRGLESTIFAAATETVRPLLTGVYWDIHENDITFVSSDTHKLVRFIDTGVQPGFEASFILPPKPASIIRSIIGKDAGFCTVSIDGNGGVFDFGNLQLSCRFLNGRYPDYNRVIPKENPITMTVDRESLLNAMRRVSLCASMASGLVRMTISSTEVLLSGRDLDYARSAEERVPCSYDSQQMTIGFNSAYLIEILSNLNGGEAVVNFSEPSRPGLFRPAEQEAGTDLLMLLMPMQVIE